MIVLVRREDSEVLVETCGCGVVVPGADVRVPAEKIAFAADDQRHLRVDLQVREPVRDVDARLLQRPRPLDVAKLVEAGLELDEADGLLPLLGALDERRDELAVVARAVHGGLHRVDVRVADGGLGEHLEARAERSVRLVHQHVAAADLVEDLRQVALCARQASGYGRDPRLVLEVGPVDGHELLELREVEEAVDAVDLGLVRLEAALQARDHLGGRRRAHLDAHDVAEAPSAELALDRLEQVVGVVGDLEVGVARHAKDGSLEDLDTREEGREEVSDDLLERDVDAAAAEFEEARQSLGDLDACEARLAEVRILREDREGEREARDVRERLSGPHGERCQHREDLAMEAAFELVELLRSEILDAADRDALGLERWAELLLPESRLEGGELEHALPDPGERLLWREAVRGPDGETRLGLAEKAGDSHLEELVEVRGEDPAVVDAFQQRQPLVRRELEHACVELEVRELAIEERLGRFGANAGRHHDIVYRSARLVG